MNVKRNSSFGRPDSAGDSSRSGPVLRILVVDDDPDILLLNTDLLKRSGYEVDTATDGEAALKALESDSYDLLLTDHCMPRITGLELIKTLRAMHNAMPVILVSGTMPSEELGRHPWLKIESVLFKPYHGRDLLAAVTKILEVDSVWEIASGRSSNE